MGFLDRVTRKTTDKAADRVSDKIVNSIFGKKRKDDGNETVQQAPAVENAEPETVAVPETRPLTAEEQQAIANAQAASAESMQAAMGMAYNTKKCPECQAICFNAPVTCPYCGADLKAVKPLTPEELEKLMDKE